MNQLLVCKTQPELVLKVCREELAFHAGVRHALLQPVDERKTKRQRWAADSRTLIKAIKSAAKQGSGGIPTNCLPSLRPLGTPERLFITHRLSS